MVKTLKIKNIKIVPENNEDTARIDGTNVADGSKVVTTNNHQTTAPIFNLPKAFFGSLEVMDKDGIYHSKKVFTRHLGGGVYELNIDE